MKYYNMRDYKYPALYLVARQQTQSLTGIEF